MKKNWMNFTTFEADMMKSVTGGIHEEYEYPK